MKTRYPFLPDSFDPIPTSRWPAASAVVRGVRANSGVTTPKLCGGGPELADFQRAKPGS